MRFLFPLSVLALVAGLATPVAAQEKVGMLDYAKRLSVAAISRYDFEYAGKDADPTLEPGKQFTVGLQAAYLLNPNLTLTTGSAYLVDSKQVRSWVGLSMPFYGPQIPQAMPR